ncbi:MAG: VOC family protein [Candidatus Sumerlaeota bacterium]|nr:VOC family protein [Candidatus Sumerlaeota bacterium]
MKRYMKTLSHVGVLTSDIDKSLQWYTEVLGLEEAFRLYNKQGNLTIIYLQLSPTTFVELFKGNPNQPQKMNTHFAIEVANIEEAVADLQKRLPPESRRKERDEIVVGTDGSKIYNFYDPDGNRIEFMEFIPTSQQAQAMARVREKSSE